MSDQHAGSYLVGIATTDVTPSFGTPMGGYAARAIHSSTGVYHPLRAVAVAIDDGRTPILLLSAEWIGFYDQTDRVRRYFSEITTIPEKQIVLTGTHTHCGPAIRMMDRENHGWIDEEYLSDAIERMARAASIAWRHRYPANIKYGVGHCDMAMYRRVPDPAHPGRIRRGMAPNPDGPADHDVGVMTIESADDGMLRGVLFNYACHPTSRNRLLLGGDYVGFAYDTIGEAFATAQPCFLQGCAGDQKPRPVDPNATTFGRRSVEQVRELGEELGQAVISLINEEKLKPVTGPLAVEQSILTLETEPAEEEVLRKELHNKELRYRQHWARRHLDRIERGLPQEIHVPFELQTITFGQSLVAVAMSAEMTVEHGLRLKRELGPHFEHVLPMGYTNGIIGYVPVKRQFPEFGYEVLDANQRHHRTGRYVETTEDQIHDEIHRMMRTPVLSLKSRR